MARDRALSSPMPICACRQSLTSRGVALFDELVSDEVRRCRLVRPSNVTLDGFGYYVITGDETLSSERTEARELVDWLFEEARTPRARN